MSAERGALTSDALVELLRHEDRDVRNVARHELNKRTNVHADDCGGRFGGYRYGATIPSGFVRMLCRNPRCAASYLA